MDRPDDTPGGTPPLPLSGLRVLELATLYAAPLIGTNLGDFGADVVKVEHPRGDDARRWGAANDGIPLWWKVLSRNKELVTLDLNDPDDRLVGYDLASRADVIIENFRPGRLDRWGLGYEELSKVNPKLVMVSVTGFGQTGPLRHRPGFGTLAEAFSGFAALTGEADGPPTLPAFGLADGVAGTTGTYAVLAALYWRDAQGGGVGQHIDLSLYEPLFSILGPQVTEYTQLGIKQERQGNRSPRTSPRNTYLTADGHWVALSAGTQQIADRVFAAMDMPHLSDDHRFKSSIARRENAEALDLVVAEWIERRDLSEVLQRFNDAEAPLTPVMDVTQIVNDPQYTERGTIVDIEDDDLGQVAMQSIVPRLSKTPGAIRFAGSSSQTLSPAEAIKRWNHHDDRKNR